MAIPQGEKGDPGDVVGVAFHTNIINENNKYVGDIHVDENDSTTLNITKINITDNDLPGAISANKISGELSANNIPNLPTSKITSGTFDAARIPDISVDKITGTLPVTKGGTGGTTAAVARTNLEVYSKDEVDSLLDNYSPTTEVDTMISNYAYSKSETYTKTEIDQAIENEKTNITVLDGIITIS